MEAPKRKLSTMRQYCAIEQTYVKGVIFAHLPYELSPDPIPYSRFTFLVEPSESLYLPHNPFLLALFRENPTKTSVVSGTPEGEVEKEERPGD